MKSKEWELLSYKDGFEIENNPKNCISYGMFASLYDCFSHIEKDNLSNRYYVAKKTTKEGIEYRGLYKVKKTSCSPRENDKNEYTAKLECDTKIETSSINTITKEETKRVLWIPNRESLLKETEEIKLKMQENKLEFEKLKEHKKNVQVYLMLHKK